MDLNVTIREFFFTIDASTVRFPSLKVKWNWNYGNWGL